MNLDNLKIILDHIKTCVLCFIAMISFIVIVHVAFLLMTFYNIGDDQICVYEDPMSYLEVTCYDVDDFFGNQQLEETNAQDLSDNSL